MYVDLRAPGLRLSRGRAHAMLLRIRAAFASLSHAVARIVVRVMPADPGAPTLRECAIEVHLRDGQVEVVQERQRRLADVLSRALQRAWLRTARRLPAPERRRV